MPSLAAPFRVIADRVLCDRADRAIDLLSGVELLVRVTAIEPAVEQRAWAERCARWYARRDPRAPRLRDFGIVNEHLRFEAIEPARRRCEALPPAWPPGPGRTARARVHCVQPRAAVGRVMSWLEEPGGRGRVAEVHVCGPPGSGLSTSADLIARDARLLGFVPVGVTMLASLPREVRDDVFEILGMRHLLVLWDARRRRRDEASVLARLARSAERPIAMVTLDRVAPRSGRFVLLDPLDARALARAIGVEEPERLKAGDRRRFRACVERSEGWPGRFLEAWRRTPAVRYPATRPRLPIAAERAPHYGADAREAPATSREPDASDAESRETVDRAARLARAGRHAAARLILRECASRLERRSAGSPLARVHLALGRLALERGRIAEAVAALDAARHAAPPEDDGGMGREIAEELCRAFIEMGELRRAEAVARMTEAGARPAPPPPGIALALAEALYWQARYDEADDAAIHAGERSAVEALALRGRIALARGDLGEAGALAQRALELTGASESADSANRLPALAIAVLVSGSIADVVRVREYSATAMAIARQSHLPMWALQIRLARVDAFLRANEGAEARVAARGFSRLVRPTSPRLVRARATTLLAAMGLAKWRPDDCEGIQALADLHAALAPGSARTTKRRVRDDLTDLLELVQDAPDELSALQRASTFVAGALRHATVVVFGVDGSNTRVVAHSAALTGPAPEVAVRAVTAGLLVGPSRGSAGVDAACPIRFAGARIGAVFCRWAVEGPLDWTRVELLLTAMASIAAPCVRAVLDRGHERARASAADLIGDSDAMRRLRDEIAKAAPAPFAVLIEGESGSGKELVARAIHRVGARRDRAWCAINCAALSDDLLEAELFGHARGAFTGALAERRGLFEEADGGTLLLDEVGELSPRAQAKLLRTIQEGEVRRLGENASRRVDVRIVAATNRRLESEVSAGRFRQDLWYRLAVVRLFVPPLRARVGDVPELAKTFWRRATERIGSRAVLAPTALAALARYDWPGNVRELQNVIAALSVAAPKRGPVGPSFLPDAIVRAGAVEASTLDEARRTFERRFVRAALARAGGRLGTAARELGITRQGLSKLLQRLDLEATRTGAADPSP